jgi:hypothetical protein
MRSRYYAAVVMGMLRGLLMSSAELATLRPPVSDDGPLTGGLRVNG